MELWCSSRCPPRPSRRADVGAGRCHFLHCRLRRFRHGSKNFDELIAREDFEVTGDLARLRAFAENLDVFDFGFEIVLP